MFWFFLNQHLTHIPFWQYKSLNPSQSLSSSLKWRLKKYLPWSEKGTTVERENRSVVRNGWEVGRGDNYKGAGRSAAEGWNGSIRNVAGDIDSMCLSKATELYTKGVNLTVCKCKNQPEYGKKKLNTDWAKCI